MKCYNCGSTNTYVKDYKNNFTINEKNNAIAKSIANTIIFLG